MDNIIEKDFITSSSNKYFNRLVDNLNNFHQEFIDNISNKIIF